MITFASGIAIGQIKPIKRGQKPKTEQTKGQKKKQTSKKSSTQNQNHVTNSETAKEKAIQTAKDKGAEAAQRVADELRNDGDQMTPNQYDHPIINMKEIKDKLENQHYLVFLDTKGTVVGFNKSTRKYFTIYAGSNGPASSITFGGGNNLFIKTCNGSINYNLDDYRVSKSRSIYN